MDIEMVDSLLVSPGDTTLSKDNKIDKLLTRLIKKKRQGPE